jgi:hypothetical protein
MHHQTKARWQLQHENAMAPLNSSAIRTEIIIRASPERVREVMLNFERISSLNNRFMTHLTAYRSNTDQEIPASQAVVGDTVKLSSATSIIGESLNTVFVRRWFSFPQPVEQCTCIL